MGNIVDLSKFQKSSNIDWATFSKNVDLIIARVQYGSTRPDSEYNNHIANAKKYGLKFNTYTFPAFISVQDARVEARDCYTRHDKDSGFIWLDIESEYDSNRNPIGITKLPQNVRLEGLKAYVDELRKQGAKKVGAYIAHNVYEPWQINTIIGIFDAIWIPRYGNKPKYPCDLHQYTESGRVSGYNGNLDLSVLNGDKSLEYFTGNAQATPTVQPQAANNSKYPVQPVSTGNLIVAKVEVIVDSLNCRQHPDPNSPVLFVARKGQQYNVTANVNDWHEVIIDNDGHNGYLFGNGGTYLSLVRDNPEPKIHIVTKGETLGKIASSNGTTVANLCALNGISNPDKISIGQKIKVS